MADQVHLIRHGEVHNPDRLVYADLPGFGLSERGSREAHTAAAYLADRPISAVYSSPLDRARQTAAIIAAAHNLEVIIEEELTEWRLAQRWQGLPWDDLPVAFPGEVEAYLHHPTDLPFSPEPLQELGERMAGAIHRIEANVPDGEVVIVSHQDPIQAGRIVLEGRSLSELNTDKPGHADVVSLVPGDSAWTELFHWQPDLDGSSPPAWPPGGDDMGE